MELKPHHKIFITFFLLSTYFINWYGWNEISHFVLLKSIVETASFRIDDYAEHTGDRVKIKGHYYSDKEPGLAFLASPSYTLFKLLYQLFPEDFKDRYSFNPDKYWGFAAGTERTIFYLDLGFFDSYARILVTISTSVLFSCLVSYLLYKRFLRKKIFLLFPFYLGTIWFIYSIRFMNHITSSFFLLLSFTLLSKNSKKMFLSFLFLSLSILVDRSSILFFLVFLPYALPYFRKNVVVASLGFMLGLIPLMLYNFFITSHPFIFPSTYVDVGIFREAYKFSRFSSLDEWLRLFHFEKRPNLFVMLRILFYPYRGFFFYSPVLLFSLYCCWKERGRRDTLFFLTLLLIYPLFISMRKTWWGGACFGERYMVPLIPFLFIPIFRSYQKFPRNLKKMFVIVSLLSIFITFMGLNYAENVAFDRMKGGVRQEWEVKQNSLEPFADPLTGFYWPQFLSYGPRSRLFEEFLVGHVFNPNILILPEPKGYEEFTPYKPFSSLIPLIPLIFTFRKELRSVIRWVKRL